MSAGAGAESSTRVIKRYANRKLYDTRDSRYITLQQIAELVRAGEEVRIIDNRTKEDLTHVTLAQIVYEQQKRTDEGSSSARSLRHLIEEGRERIMTTIREGRMGRLVSRRESGGEGAADEGPAPTLEGRISELEARVAELEARLRALEEE